MSGADFSVHVFRPKEDTLNIQWLVNLFKFVLWKFVDSIHNLSQTSDSIYNNIWHGSVASYLRCGAMFNDHCFTNLLPSLIVKEFWQSAVISWSYGQDYSLNIFFDSRGTIRNDQGTFLK